MSSNSRKANSTTIDSSSKHFSKGAKLLHQCGFEGQTDLTGGNCCHQTFPVLSGSKKKSGTLGVQGRVANRFPAYIKLLTEEERAAGNPLNLASAVVRNDVSPTADGGIADAQRPRDIRGFLKVIENFTFQHARSLSALDTAMQAHLESKGLSLLNMDMPLSTLAQRLKDAMEKADVNASQLAEACGVSPTAVGYWLAGTSKRMTALNYENAARFLGVRAEWLRTGKGPRERDAQDVQVERLIAAAAALREPIAAFSAALDAVFPKAEEKRKQRG